MRLWNDDLRFCRKCKRPCELHGESEAPCPHCGATVWFFNYKPVSEPPEVPKSPEHRFWNDITGRILIGVTGLWGVVALSAIQSGAVVSAMSALTALGFGVFSLFRHKEAVEFDARLKHEDAVREYGNLQAGRIEELTQRYQHLLLTGNSRIEQYFNEIHVSAEKLLEEAKKQRELASSVERRIYAISERFVDDHRKWSTQKIRSDPENYQRRKMELSKAFDFVENVGYDLPREIRENALNKLKESYKQKVYEQKLKDEQREIKRQMQEEARIQREREQAQKEAEQREREIKLRLEAALAEQKDSHSAEIEDLRRQLAEAEANSQRALSMAQQTKAGHVYILSNIGSFGENIFKVGMTRRLEPDLRVKELGDASVPFPFDVHAMISCDNAPDLEKQLHHELTRYRVNRVNLRKEYFSVELDTILASVRTHHGHIEYVAEPEALEYRETQNINPEELIILEKDLAEMGINFEDGDED